MGEPIKQAHSFQHVTDLAQFPKELRGGVVAIGNFDGVHRGHRAVLDLARDEAEKRGVAALAMTFEPHPRSFFMPDTPVFRLTPSHIKAEILEAEHLDGVIELPFTKEFASMAAQDFVEDILVGKLGISQSITGYDFHFGKGRQGTPQFLREAGEKYGFAVTIVSAEGDEGGDIISSSRIRSALAQGDLALANALLGYRYFVEAVVQHGEKRGRELGYPTANLKLADNCELKEGVYAVQIKVDGVKHDGVASFGRRPTFDDGAPLLEVHIFDFDGNLYEKSVAVCFIGFIRSELKFDGIDALITQMDQDSAEARAMIASMRPLSPLDQMLNTNE
ncbi:Riboflavin biosynthesis protein RibF [Pseudovibrio axinellae]|uniref:Riboflavin biosynthesis protein n=1 Tax=Pseudovibrio axinellae TaxID=989403 RepID=A0A165YCI5_9HYPH|nr:bifunctional riboflavin kinase/FAD synthetase [Pseudovibrio axinellae]KZL18716.1 Riboflavin biosynthesis protein RibF [Pseudovibrio axinellae]SEP95549.1 riboflavin kinase / FMN adenylyltransferase [Pseudovibrio axinellae]